MKFRYRNICVIFVILLFLVGFMPVTAKADMGPKPSVQITFKNMGDELCFGTLLAKNKSTGPYSYWGGDDKYANHNENEGYEDALLNYEQWKAFNDFAENDGFYFLQRFVVEVSKTKEISWTYYPPSTFKILLYYPNTKTFVVSDVCEKYAFDSYFTVNMKGVDIDGVENNGENHVIENIKVHKSYKWFMEFVGFIARVILTIAIEIGIGYLFGFKRKEAILMLLKVNLITQIGLNVILNVINFISGQLAFFLAYVAIETVIIILESILYCNYRNKLSTKPKIALLCELYALVANLSSFAIGIILTFLIPGIF